MKQVAVSPHIFSCCKKSNNEKYKVYSEKQTKKTSDFKKVCIMYRVWGGIAVKALCY
jgi:hypothetical protein